MKQLKEISREINRILYEEKNIRDKYTKKFEETYTAYKTKEYTTSGGCWHCQSSEGCGRCNPPTTHTYKVPYEATRIVTKLDKGKYVEAMLTLLKNTTNAIKNFNSHKNFIKGYKELKYYGEIKKLLDDFLDTIINIRNKIKLASKLVKNTNEKVLSINLFNKLSEKQLKILLDPNAIKLIKNGSFQLSHVPGISAPNLQFIIDDSLIRNKLNKKKITVEHMRCFNGAGLKMFSYMLKLVRNNTNNNLNFLKANNVENKITQFNFIISNTNYECSLLAKQKFESYYRRGITGSGKYDGIKHKCKLDFFYNKTKVQNGCGFRLEGITTEEHLSKLLNFMKSSDFIGKIKLNIEFITRPTPQQSISFS